MGSLLGRQRRRLHEAALEGLQQSGSEDYALLTYHAEGAGRYDDMVEMARCGAAHYLRTGATQAALRLAERGLAEASDDVDLLATASVAAWRVLTASAMPPPTPIGGTPRQGRRARPRQDPRALRLRARVEFDAGRASGQLQYLEEALGVVEPLGETEELAWVYAQLAEAHMLLENMEQAIEWADRALELAERVGAGGAKVRALVNKGSAMIDRDIASGIEVLEEAALLAESIGDDLSLVRSINNALIGGVLVWPPERTAAAIDRMQEVAERAGLDHFAVMAVRNRAFAADLEGDLNRALALFSGLDWDEQVGEYESTRIHQATLHCDANDPDGAAALLNSMEEPEEPSKRCCYVFVRTYVATLRRDADAVRLLMARFADDPSVAPSPGRRRRLHDGPARPQGGGLRPRGAGIPRFAPERATRSIMFDPTFQIGVGGALLAAEGSHEDAVAAYQRALAPDGRRRGAARIASFRFLLAHSLLALGRKGEAIPHAREAWRLLERWPGWLADETLALLRRLGVGPETEGPKELTSREREVASLLAEGLSNAELADRLYISVRTAQVHVSHILTKLGMSSRAESPLGRFATDSPARPTGQRAEARRSSLSVRGPGLSCAAHEGPVMSTEHVWLTRAAYDNLAAELSELLTEGRRRMEERLAEARSHGDIRENADYDSAKDEQALMEARIRQLQHLIDTAEVRDVENNGTVQVGSIVTVVDGDGDRLEYFVAPQENQVPGYLLASPSSPLGIALIGTTVGDEVRYEAPGGTFTVRVAAVRPFEG